MLHNRMKNTIATLRQVTCPSCKKDRLLKEVGDDGAVVETSTQTVDVRGQSRFMDVCNFCISKYRQEDQRFMVKNLRKLKQAMRLRKDDSDHNDFSLDV